MIQSWEELPHSLEDRTKIQKDVDRLKQWGHHQQDAV